MWFLDGPEYYAPPGARYLSYDNDVRVVDEVAASPRFKGIMPVLHRHLVGTAYQLAQFRLEWEWEWGAAALLLPPCRAGRVVARLLESRG